MFFSDATKMGFDTWPFEREETQGYIIQQPTGQIDLRAYSHVYPDHLPADVQRWPGRVIGTFHSHPTGCRGNSCYYQPPSVLDLESFRALATGPLGLTLHIVVTANKLFVVESTSDRSPETNREFQVLISNMTRLKDADLSPTVQEPQWMAAVRKFPRLLKVSALPI